MGIEETELEEWLVNEVVIINDNVRTLVTNKVWEQ